jgi:hypothetical protein
VGSKVGWKTLIENTMKKIYYAAMFLLSVLTNVEAQTNQVPNLLGSTQISPAYSGLLQEAWNDYLLSTNSAIAVSGGADTTFKKYIVAVDYVYDLNQNAGLVIGWDNIWDGASTNGSVANSVRGGLQLQATFQPLQTFGVTNIVAKPFAGELASTVLSGPSSGNIGLVSFVGVNFDLYSFSWGNLQAGGFYENRTSQGWASGNYLLADLALTLNRIKVGGKPW